MTSRITVRFSSDAAEWLRSEAASQGCTVSKVVTDLVESRKTAQGYSSGYWAKLLNLVTDGQFGRSMAALDDLLTALEANRTAIKEAQETIDQRQPYLP